MGPVPAEDHRPRGRRVWSLGSQSRGSTQGKRIGLVTRLVSRICGSGLRRGNRGLFPAAIPAQLGQYCYEPEAPAREPSALPLLARRVDIRFLKRQRESHRLSPRWRVGFSDGASQSGPMSRIGLWGPKQIPFVSLGITMSYAATPLQSSISCSYTVTSRWERWGPTFLGA
jgi:hypothetical protein